MTPSGMEPVTIRFVAQRLNHCATAEINSKWMNDYVADKPLYGVVLTPWLIYLNQYLEAND